MGLIGFYIAAKGLDKALSSGGGGYYGGGYDYERKAAEKRAKQLCEVRDAMQAVHGYEVTDGVEVPAKIRRGVQRLFISKKRDIKHRSIIVLKADPNGVQMPNTGVDLSKYSVVGVVDQDTLCLLEKDTGDMLMVKTSADFDCGPHGDYNATTEPFTQGTGHLDERGYDLRSTHISFTRVKANGEIQDRAPAPEEFAQLQEETTKHYPKTAKVIHFGAAIYYRVSAFKERQAAEANKQAEQKQRQ